MKSKIIVYTLLVSILFTLNSCKKNTDDTDDIKKEIEVIMKINGVDWKSTEAYAYGTKSAAGSLSYFQLAALNDAYSIAIQCDSIFESGECVFEDRFREGNHIILSTSDAVTPFGTYNHLNRNSARCTITNYASTFTLYTLSTGYIEGDFSAELINNYPPFDTIRITQGRIRIKP